MSPPLSKFHSDFPLAASRAKNSPCVVPPKTSPPAVDITPPHGGLCSLNSHCTSPVCGFSARPPPHGGLCSFNSHCPSPVCGFSAPTAPHPSSSGTARNPPALNSAPDR